MSFETEILIIGGGLAGLTAAIHLQKFGLNVTLVEKQAYPHHKICGEYISNEVLPYLKWLDIDIEKLSPASITNLQFSSNSGKIISTKLPLGGFGLSRFTMDYLFYQIARQRGVNVFQDTVEDVIFSNDQFVVKTLSGQHFSAKQVIGAYGKRAPIDIKLERKFILRRSPYLAVKAHYRSNFPDHLVSLNSFKGGYCGLSKVEQDKLNICYLADYESFKKHKNIKSYQEKILYQNKYLKYVFENSEMIFDAPLTISQISFEPKEPVTYHILMVGDTAGLIHPLCGNGMAMAIHSAKIVSELLIKRFSGEIKSRTALEKNYTAKWKSLFSSRLRMGRMLAAILKNDTVERFAMQTVNNMPFLLKQIIKHTHGQPLVIPN